MTVASLWKALDRAKCGKAIGAEGLLDHQRLKPTTNPWNCNNRARPHYPTLAIDLSIWICESLSSSAMAENHADPTLHLVFARTLKLLTLGVKLIAVIEGKRRLRVEGKHDEFQKRRSGTRFWVACQRCEEMLGLLGVPVVRAVAEGEALCALLNQKGVVDGVISHDGDCFLFGAKILYTKFSIENLNEGKLMRYDCDDLVACLDDDDSDEIDEKARKDSATPLDIVKLNRTELMVFAILTGSDAAGSGLPKVGCRKALRFIRKCQIDNPLRSETAAIDELLSWAKTTRVTVSANEKGTTVKKCSHCCHEGTKSSHLKNGCVQCGTSAGEPCFHVSPGGRFRKSLRAKALAMGSQFDPETVMKVYQSPNDDQIPLIFLGKTSRDVLMKTPDLQGFLNSSFIIRGRSYAESRGYILQALSRLMAKSELSNLCTSSNSVAIRPRTSLPTNRNKPVLKKVVKSVTRSSIACCEVLWTIKATTTDSQGNPIDEFEFSTIEELSFVKKHYPNLVDEFMSNAKERLKQGTAEQERRKAFLESMSKNKSQVSDERLPRANHKGTNKSGREFFSRKTNSYVSNSFQWADSFFSCPEVFSSGNMGDDVAQLLQEVTGQKLIPRRSDNSEDNESIDSVSTISLAGIQLNGSAKNPMVSYTNMKENSPYKFTLSPGHLHFLGAIKIPGKREQSLKAPQGIEERDERLKTFADYGDVRKIGLCNQESFRANLSILPASRSPGLVNHFPDLKRSRLTRTPPIPDRSLDYYGCRFTENEKKYSVEDVSTYVQRIHTPQRPWGGQFETLASEENHLVANYEHRPGPTAHTSSVPFGAYTHEHYQNQEQCPLNVDGEVADMLDNSFPVVAVDKRSIRSAHSPHPRRPWGGQFETGNENQQVANYEYRSVPSAHTSSVPFGAYTHEHCQNQEQCPLNVDGEVADMLDNSFPLVAVDRRSIRSVHSSHPRRLWGGQFETLAGEENQQVANYEYLPVPTVHATSVPFGAYTHEHYQNQEQFSLNLDGDVADAIDDSFPLVAVDKRSIRSAHSPHARITTDRANPSPPALWYRPEESFIQYDPSDDVNANWLAAAPFPQSYCSEIHEVFSDRDHRRNLDVEGYGKVETAMAKWENKIRFAKMDEENCHLMQGTQGYDDCQNLFGEF